MLLSKGAATASAVLAPEASCLYMKFRDEGRDGEVLHHPRVLAMLA